MLATRTTGFDATRCSTALLMSQGVTEPINTFKGWQELGRQVQKGSKAKFIIRPITIKRENDKGEEEQFLRFKPVNCLFTVSETEGDDLPEYEPPEWSEKRALGALAINRVAYEGLDGNVAGYSYERNVAVSPRSPLPVQNTDARTRTCSPRTHSSRRSR